MQITVFDPAAEPVPGGPSSVLYKEDGSKKRIGEVAGWSLVRDLRARINEGWASVQYAQGGGPGNPDGLCREMSCRWLLEEMIGAMDPERVDPDHYTGPWVRVPW